MYVCKFSVRQFNCGHAVAYNTAQSGHEKIKMKTRHNNGAEGKADCKGESKTLKILCTPTKAL